MTTRERISDLEEKIKKLQQEYNHIKKTCTDFEVYIDYELKLSELKEQLNFAWQDDEKEWLYAVEQQEFNPDGSLKGY